MSMSPEEVTRYQEAFAELSAQYEDPADDTEVPDPEEEGDDEGEIQEESEEGSDESDDEGSDEESDSIEIDGTAYTRAELSELARVRDHLAANPDTRQALEQVANARPTERPAPSVPAYTPPQPPEDLDLDDPSVRALWEGYTQIHQSVEAQRQELVRRQYQEDANSVQRAVDDWSDKYHLEGDNLQKVRTEAAKLNMIGNLTANGMSTYEATVHVMEAAFWSDADLRSQYLNAAAEDNKRNETKQRTKTRKLGALAGRGTTSGGSKPVAEMTRDERQAAMVAELTDHLNRN